MMIIYASCTCTARRFAEIFRNPRQMPGQQVQKYHRLIMEGLAMNGARVKSISALPVSKANCNRRLLKKTIENDKGIEYTYLTLFNLPFIKNVFVFIGSFIHAVKYLREDKDAVVINDVLNISVSMGTLLAAKLMKRSNVGIVTDVPSFLNEKSRSVYVKLNNILIRQYGSYVFLTEQMNELVNQNMADYQVIEGQVDINMQRVGNELKDKYPEKVCIYAGGLHQKYGIKTLTEAFVRANIADSELHIYGSGDYETELAEICKNNAQIKYFGVVANHIVVQEELKATLLINPRPTHEEFTKYSFPSKNMEYMVSGTPVLTTRLPGMPKEYFEFVYLFDQETVEGYAVALARILNKSRSELHNMGLAAKDFVINKKNNVIQSRRIMDMVLKSGKECKINGKKTMLGK
jgi:glycosyltransferase involved in cell wall biosynthesis